MSDGQLRVYVKQFVDDLAGRSIGYIERACAHYRRDATNKSMATSGQLLAIIRDIEGPKENTRYKEQAMSRYNRPAINKEKKELDERLQQRDPQMSEEISRSAQEIREAGLNVTRVIHSPKSPSETIKAIEAGRLWDSTKSRTPYTRSPDECIKAAKDLVQKARDSGLI